MRILKLVITFILKIDNWSEIEDKVDVKINDGNDTWIDNEFDIEIDIKVDNWIDVTI